MTTIAGRLEEFYLHRGSQWGETFNFPNSRRFRQFSHRIYNRYPARSIALVPRAILGDLANVHVDTDVVRVLDPFMGSGTTAVEATLRAMMPYGVEIDPFARLISAVRVHVYDNKGLASLNEGFSKLAHSWKKVRADQKLFPQLINIDHWFTRENLLNLLKLKTAIYQATEPRSSERDFFRVVFADMIRPCSKAERQTLKPYISTKYAKKPADVGTAFEKSFRAHWAAINDYSQATCFRGAEIQWLGCDASAFKCATNTIDVAITSPPYINALDYVRCIKIESAWIDTGDDEVFADLRTGQIGGNSRSTLPVSSEVLDALRIYLNDISKVDPSRSLVVRGYFNDMFANLRCVYDCLKSGAEYHLIVGDSVIRGNYIPTHSLLAHLGEACGFKWVGYYNYALKDHRTSIPRNGQGGKINVEHVVTLKKSL
jgi:DNA modification methylase